MNKYIDNKRFCHEMILWQTSPEYHEWMDEKALAVKEKSKTPPAPQLPSYIGECFLLIAENLARRPNFSNYTYLEDMIGDGIENCISYASNYDATKTNNPFAYFTQIIYYAFIRRISKEKEQAEMKFRVIERSIENGAVFDYLKELGNRSSVLSVVYKNVEVNEDEPESTPKEEDDCEEESDFD